MQSVQMRKRILDNVHELAEWTRDTFQSMIKVDSGLSLISL